MTNTRPVKTPIQRDCYAEDITEKLTDVPFREILGSLNFLSSNSRPDITFAVSWLSRYLDKVTQSKWTAAKNLLRYLAHTIDLGIMYRSDAPDVFEFYSDADYAADPLSRKSVSGSVTCSGGSPVSWHSRKQSSTSLSSTESELIAACETAKGVVYLKKFLSELGIEIVPEIRIDNLSTIRLVKDKQFHRRTKHIEVRYFYIREQVEEGNLTVAFVPTSQQLADLFTKPTNSVIFTTLRDQLMTRNPFPEQHKKAQENRTRTEDSQIKQCEASEKENSLGRQKNPSKLKKTKTKQ